MKWNSTLDIYITEICNLNCEYCYIDIKKKEYNWFNYVEFIDRINLLQYNTIRFLWWEPLLKWNDLKNVIRNVKKINDKIQFIIITNWILLDNEKLIFLSKNNVSIAISLHFNVIKEFKNKEFLKLLYKYNNIIWFIVLFNYKKEYLWTNIMFFLANIWFLNFSLSPITTDNWDDTFLLSIELEKIFNFLLLNKNINIAESDWNFIKNLHTDDFCSRKQVDKEWTYRPCNRFNDDFFNKNTNIKVIKDSFNKINSCSTCNVRWFCVCPYWWYYDNFWNSLVYDKNKIKNFHNLNKILIDFNKNVAKLRNKKNFLIDDIGEIRFNLTNQCNLRCNYCYVQFDNDKLDLNIWKNIINFLLEQEWLNKTISFFWWEPLLEFKLLEDLTNYAIEKSVWLNKIVNFKIATNLLLLDKYILDFFIKNNFKIHISLNWDKQINNSSRDNSSELLLKKIELLNKWNINFDNITILKLIFPYNINFLNKNLKYIYGLWFNNISFELYYWKKYTRSKKDILLLGKSFYYLKKYWILNKFNILNWKDNNYLDISVDGKINDNSLEFFNWSIDFSIKKIFNKILTKTM